MTEHPPRKVRVLTRLKISEVSCVDRGAGEGCKVLISKRYEDDDRPLSAAEIARSKMEGRAALRDAEDRFVKQHSTGFAEHEPDEPAPTPEDDPSRFLFSKETFLRKSYAAVARGDEADRRDEETPVDELVDGGNDHHASKVADLLVESGSHSTREDALAYLLHHKDGAALLRRLSKQHYEDNPMSLDLSSVVKAHGIGALCRHIVKSASSFGIDEHQLVDLATQDAARRYPSDTPPQAFAKLFMESAELREAIEVAKGAALQDAVTAELERDSREAMKELSEIGKARWGSLSKAQQFARAFETNPELAMRALRRPGPSVSFPHPVVKEKQPMVASLEPRVSDERNVDDPARALEQLKQIARERWPNESEAQAFINVMSNAEYGELIHRALARPTGSTPPRQ
jgi:hypothetical protein